MLGFFLEKYQGQVGHLPLGDKSIVATCRAQGLKFVQFRQSSKSAPKLSFPVVLLRGKQNHPWDHFSPSSHLQGQCGQSLESLLPGDSPRALPADTEPCSERQWQKAGIIYTFSLSAGNKHFCSSELARWKQHKSVGSCCCCHHHWTPPSQLRLGGNTQLPEQE